MENEKKLKNELERLYAAVESSSNHIILTDIDGKITYANKAAQEITGYSFEEMKGKTPRLWGGRMPKEYYQKLWHVIKEEKKPYIGEVENQRKNGELYVAIIRVSQVYEDGKLIGFIGTEEDITKERKSKDLLEEEKAKLEAAVLAIGYGLVLTDKEGYIKMVNESFCKTLGWDRSEVLGKELSVIIPMLDKGENIIPSTDRLIYKAINEGKSFISNPEDEIFYVRKDKTYFPVNVTVSPIMYKGSSIGAVEVFRDVTKEKQIDKSKKEFFSLASHQLRTPLSAINWYIELLKGSNTDNLDSMQHKYLSEIYSASFDMVDLVNTFLNISRLELGSFQQNPNFIKPIEVLNNILSILKPLIIEKNLQIQTDIQKDLKIDFDENILKILLQNILSNSVKYTRQNGHIVVKIESDIKGMFISVADDGYGIPEGQRNSVFSKLFRADNIKDIVPDGTGVGLYLVKKLIDDLKGEITFESRENEGTIFKIFLPRSSK